MRQTVCLIADRHLALLHRFEQRALHFRGRAVDFVREQQVREHGSLLRRELAGLRRIDERSHDIGRQKVRREGDALEVETERLGERIHAERLGEARHTFQKNVSIRDEREDEPVDELLLSDDDLADLFTYLGDQIRLCGDLVCLTCQIHIASVSLELRVES